MKNRALILTLLLGTLLAGSALQARAREVININRNWRFFSNSHTSDNATMVNLPHTWNRDALGGHNDYYRGIGNYIKDIKVPAEWRGKRVFIRFGAAGDVANLAVNGRHVGEHRGGFTGFTFELTPYLRFGETNSIWVIVNNSPQMDVLPTAGDHNVYGGLYRDVELIVTEQSVIRASEGGIRLVQKAVSSERAAVDAVIRIDGQRDRNLLVNLAVTTPRRDTIFFQASRFRVPASGIGTVTIPIELESPTLWNGVENPYLYNVIVKVTDQNVTCDSLAVPLGLRYFSVDPKTGFALNGRPLQLHGVFYYEDRASVGPALTEYQIREDLDYMVEMGVNAVRTSPGPHSQEFYDECDRRGLIVWSDLPFVGPSYLTDRGYIGTESFRANGVQQLREMISQYYNHPSIAMWGLFSNQSMRGDDPTPYIKELNTVAREEDPTRMTVGASNQDGQMNFITKLVVWDTEDAELDAEPFRESRLAARRRTRDQHDLRPAFLVLYGYPVGDVTHAFFVQGLAHADQLAAFAFENLRVERPDVRDADDIDPARVFLENLEHFALRHLFFELRRRGAVRYGHPEPFIVFVQVEQVDVSGRNGESPVEITDDVGHLVEGDVQVRTRDE